MSLTLVVEKLTAVLERAAAAAAGEDVAAGEAGAESECKAGDGDEGKHGEQAAAAAVAATLECRLRCSWGGASGACGVLDGDGRGWREHSREWRNSHPLVADGEERSYESSRRWFSESARLAAVDEECLTALGNCGGLRLEVFRGAKASPCEGDDACVDELIGAATVSLVPLLRGDQIAESVMLELADGSGFSEVRLEVGVYPDEELLDYATGGHVLSLDACELAEVPAVFCERFLPEVEEAEPEEARAGQDSAVTEESSQVGEEEGEGGDVDQEAKEAKEAQQSKLAYSEEQAEAIAQAVEEANERLDVQLHFLWPVPEPTEPTESTEPAEPAAEEKELEQAQVEGANELEGKAAEATESKEPEAKTEGDGKDCGTQEEEDGGDSDPPAEAVFVQSKMLLGFDKQAQRFTATAGASDKAVRFLSGSSAERLQSDECGKWLHVGVLVTVNAPSPVQDDPASAEGSAAEPGLRYETAVGLHALAADDATTCGNVHSDCGCVLMTLSMAPPLRVAAPVLGESGLVIADLSPATCLASCKESGAQVIKQSDARHEIASMVSGGRESSGGGQREEMRLLLLKAVQEDPVLRERLAQRKGDAVATLFASLTDAVGGYQGVQNAWDEIARAEEAEFSEHSARADSHWRRHAAQHPLADGLVGYAKFCMRSGRCLRAAELFKRYRQLQEEQEQGGAQGGPTCLDLASYVLGRNALAMSRDVGLLERICHYEVEGERAGILDFNGGSSAEEEGEDEGKEADCGRQAAATALGFRELATLALDLCMASTARRAIIHANALDQAPLVDGALVTSELLRGRCKLLMGKPAAACDILANVTVDSERISLGDVPLALQAQAFFWLGEALRASAIAGGDANKDDLMLRSRNTFSLCLSALNEASPVADSVEAASDLLRMRVTHRLGQQSLEAGDFRKARALYRSATQLKVAVGNLSWAWTGLGRAMLGMKDTAAADDAFEKALSLDDTNAQAWAMLALLQVEGAQQPAVSGEARFLLIQALRHNLSSVPLLSRLQCALASDKDMAALVGTRLNLLR